MTEEKEKVEERPLMFKVNTVGLDTTNLNYPSSLEPGEYEYIHINFGSNNDEFTTDLVKTSRIFMTVKFLDHIQNAVMSYLKRNGIRNLDCILVDSKCNFEKSISIKLFIPSNIWSNEIKFLLNLKVILCNPAISNK